MWCGRVEASESWNGRCGDRRNEFQRYGSRDPFGIGAHSRSWTGTSKGRSIGPGSAVGLPEGWP